MTRRQEDHDLDHAIVSRLEQTIEELDPAITAQLDQARLSAIESGHAAQTQNDFVAHIELQLEKSEALPTEIERKLNQIRRDAIAQNARGSNSLKDKIQTLYQFIFATNYHLTTGMAATACVTIAVAVLFYNSSTPTDTPPLDSNIGLIASADELELYENLDFYVWLAENEVLP
ncbi:MAG: hypothetical protein ACJAY7_000728 [Pseudohongiellaceae bacterium]|jgi:hypothetical protein